MSETSEAPVSPTREIYRDASLAPKGHRNALKKIFRHSGNKIPRHLIDNVKIDSPNIKFGRDPPPSFDLSAFDQSLPQVLRDLPFETQFGGFSTLMSSIYHVRKHTVGTNLIEDSIKWISDTKVIVVGWLSMIVEQVRKVLGDVKDYALTLSAVLVQAFKAFMNHAGNCWIRFRDAFRVFFKLSGVEDAKLESQIYAVDAFEADESDKAAVSYAESLVKPESESEPFQPRDVPLESHGGDEEKEEVKTRTWMDTFPDMANNFFLRLISMIGSFCEGITNLAGSFTSSTFTKMLLTTSAAYIAVGRLDIIGNSKRFLNFLYYCITGKNYFITSEIMSQFRDIKKDLTESLAKAAELQHPPNQLQVRIASLNRKLSALYPSVLEADPQSHAIHTATYRALTAQANKFVGPGGDKRMKPIVIVLQGEPATGKTWTADLLAEQVMKVVANNLPAGLGDDLPIYSEHAHKTTRMTIPCLDEKTEYDEGYNDPLFYILNELYTPTDPAVLASWSTRFMAIADSSPLPLNMAFEEKGKRFFTSPFVIATGNFKDGAHVHNVNSPDAYFRRIELDFTVTSICPEGTSFNPVDHSRFTLSRECIKQALGNKRNSPILPMFAALHERSLHTPFTYTEVLYLVAAMYIERITLDATSTHDSVAASVDLTAPLVTHNRNFRSLNTTFKNLFSNIPNFSLNPKEETFQGASHVETSLQEVDQKRIAESQELAARKHRMAHEAINTVVNMFGRFTTFHPMAGLPLLKEVDAELVERFIEDLLDVRARNLSLDATHNFVNGVLPDPRFKPLYIACVTYCKLVTDDDLSRFIRDWFAAFQYDVLTLRKIEVKDYFPILDAIVEDFERKVDDKGKEKETSSKSTSMAECSFSLYGDMISSFKQILLERSGGKAKENLRDFLFGSPSNRVLDLETQGITDLDDWCDLGEGSPADWIKLHWDLSRILCSPNTSTMYVELADIYLIARRMKEVCPLVFLDKFMYYIGNVNPYSLFSQLTRGRATIRSTAGKHLQNRSALTKEHYEKIKMQAKFMMRSVRTIDEAASKLHGTKTITEAETRQCTNSWFQAAYPSMTEIQQSAASFWIKKNYHKGINPRGAATPLSTKIVSDYKARLATNAKRSETKNANLRKQHMSERQGPLKKEPGDRSGRAEYKDVAEAKHRTRVRNGARNAKTSMQGGANALFSLERCREEDDVYTIPDYQFPSMSTRMFCSSTERCKRVYEQACELAYTREYGACDRGNETIKLILEGLAFNGSLIMDFHLDEIVSFINWYADRIDDKYEIFASVFQEYVYDCYTKPIRAYHYARAMVLTAVLGGYSSNDYEAAKAILDGAFNELEPRDGLMIEAYKTLAEGTIAELTKREDEAVLQAMQPIPDTTWTKVAKSVAMAAVIGVLSAVLGWLVGTALNFMWSYFYKKKLATHEIDYDRLDKDLAKLEDLGYKVYAEPLLEDQTVDPEKDKTPKKVVPNTLSRALAKRPTRAVPLSGQGMLDTASLNIVNNQVAIFSQGGVHVGNGMFVGGQVLLLNKHVFDSLSTFQMLAYNPDNNKFYNSYNRVDLTVLKEYPENDVVLVSVPGALSHRSLLSYFRPEIEITSLPINKGALSYFNTRQDMDKGDLFPVGEITPDLESHNLNTNGNPLIVSRFASYHWPENHKGACGSIMLSCSEATPKIVGLHTAGHPASGVSITTLVSREMIESVLAGPKQDRKFQGLPCGVALQAQDNVHGMYEAAENGFTTPMMTSALERTTFLPTVFHHKKFKGGSLKKPAALDVEAHRNAIVKDAANDRVFKFHPVVLSLAREHADQIAQKLVNRDMSTIKGCHTLSTSESLYGSAGLGKFDPHSSKGLRMRAWGMSKKDLFQTDTPPNPEVVDAFFQKVEEIRTAQKNGDYQYQINFEKLKDELRDLERVSLKKTRIYFVTDFVDNVLIKMALGDLVSKMKDSYMTAPAACGVNPRGDAWRMIYSMFIGKRVVFADISGFDSTLITWFFYIMQSLLNAAYVDPKEREFAWWAIISCIHGLRFNLGKGRLLNRGNTSGNWITTWLNTIVNLCYFCIAVAFLAIKHGDDPHEAIDSLIIKLYSDDNLSSLDYPWFTAKNLSDVFLSLFGVVMTSVDKGELTDGSGSGTIDEANFLSRSFLVKKGVVCAPLDEECLLSQLYYVRVPRVKRGDIAYINGQLQQNLHNVQSELLEWDEASAHALAREIENFIHTNKLPLSFNFQYDLDVVEAKLNGF